MPITFFELLAPIIDRNVDFIARQLNISIDQVYDRIVAEAERNRAEWYSDRIPDLNYRNPDCRLAYLYVVAAANAATFKHVVETNDELREHILKIAAERCQIKICALGAGPGTELLAMAKFFDERRLGLSVSVDFQLPDRVEEWANSWYGIRDEVNNAFRQLYGNNRAYWPMIPSGNFLAYDVTQLARINQLGHVWNQDIYVLNFLLSEIFDDDPRLRAFLSEVASFAPQGAKFVFIERRGPMWQSRIVGIARDAGLVLSPFTESRCDRLVGEIPHNLGKIYAAISARQHPRMHWNVVYSIGTKA